MKFVCDRCQTRYSIADEKIRQKILRIRCKTCGNVILVQESAAVSDGGDGVADPHPAASSAPGPAPSPAAKPASGPKTPPVPAKAASEPKAPPLPPGKVASGPKAPPAPPSKSPSGLRPPPAQAGMAIPPPPPPAAAADPLGGRVEWYVAVGGAQSGPFSRADAAKRILDIDPTRAVHVWKEGMAGWKPPSEVSVIAQEINLLRPAPPPPPPEAGKPPTPPPVALPVPRTGRTSEVPKASFTPAPVALPVPRTGRTSEVPKASFTPAPVALPAPHTGRTTEAPKASVTPAPVAALAPRTGRTSNAPKANEPTDFQADVDTNADAFLEQTTQKNVRPIVEALAHTFSDATTKKGKNLRDLEADPLLAPSARSVADEKTPPPVQPPASIVAKRLDAASVRVTLGEPPTLPNPSFLPPGLDAGPSVIFETSAAPTESPRRPVDGFSEVIAAMAAGAPANSPVAVPAAEFAALITAPSGAPHTELSTKSRLAELFQGRSGLKYIVAAAVLIGLVILLVVVSLRGESGKPRENPKPSEPAPVVTPQPAPALEEPQLAAAADDHAGSAHSALRHGPPGPLKTKTIGPVEKPPVAAKPSKPVHGGDVARPNPFADSAKAVSQDQISAVVRNKNNQAALKSCYERALKMDNRLTSGRMDVTVSISASGAVQRVVVNAPSSFIMVEPCIKAAVKRWSFPSSSEEYATNFPLIMQGGM